jgi:hypothetical protein
LGLLTVVKLLALLGRYDFISENSDSRTLTNDLRTHNPQYFADFADFADFVQLDKLLVSLVETNYHALPNLYDRALFPIEAEKVAV